MFVVSVKTSKKRLWALLACVAALLLMVWAAVGHASSPTAANAPVTAEGGSDTKRIAFLRSLGYRVTPQHMAVQEILIPDVFDEETTSYNELQQTAGMDLQPYHGKRVKCWTYAVQGDVSGKETEAHLYEYKQTIIAGDVAAKEADGFMRALTSVKQ